MRWLGEVGVFVWEWDGVSVRTVEATSGTRNRNRDGNSGRLQPQLQREDEILVHFFPRVFGLSLAVWETDMGWK